MASAPSEVRCSSNAEMFREHVLQAVAEAPTTTKRVVIAGEPITDVDITAADVISDLDKNLEEAGIELCFAELKGPVKDRFKRYGLLERSGSDYLYRMLEEAVDEYVVAHKVEWRDWDE